MWRLSRPHLSVGLIVKRYHWLNLRTLGYKQNGKFWGLEDSCWGILLSDIN